MTTALFPSAMPRMAKSTLPPTHRRPGHLGHPIVWSIAGSDSSGGAGLQADLKALNAFGVHACTAVAAITAQNSLQVSTVEPVSPALLNAQLAALAKDMPPQAIKTGLLGSADNVRVVCRWVDTLRAQGHQIALVVDPVLGSSTGAAFANDAVIHAYIHELLPRATLVTPNRTEAQRLGADTVQSLLGHKVSVVITGGDAAADDAHPDWAMDWMHTPQAQGWLSLPRLGQPHRHGTGCTFASTAAAALACGHCLADAVVLAKMATTHAIGHGYPAGAGAGPVCAQSDFAQHCSNLPGFTPEPAALTEAFAPLSDPALGVYAIVDSAQWVRRVLEAGIRTVQLRIKSPHPTDVAREISAAIAIAHELPDAQLFINDHWQLALELGAYGVHLGQEDLETVDLDALRQAGLRLGLSTHSYWEVARAYALRPSYIACGPIFATQSKDMPWVPQGLDNLRYWAHILPLPVVGIAGIHAKNMADVAATGVAGAAVISAITQADDPEAACDTLLRAFARGHQVVCKHPPTKTSASADNPTSKRRRKKVA